MLDIVSAGDFVLSVIMTDLPGCRLFDAAKAACAATQLLFWQPELWVKAWQGITSSPDVAQAFVEENAVAYTRFHAVDGRKSVEGRLSEAALAELWGWVEEHYPKRNDPIHHGVYSPTTRDEIGRWRDGLLNELGRRGSDAACAALRDLRQVRPDFEIIKDMLAKAQEQVRRDAWSPPNAREILSVIEKSSLRLVLAADQLLDLIIEQIHCWVNALHAEWALIEALWDKHGPGDWHPKDEASLSNQLAAALKRELAEYGVFVGRELEVNRGSETDIIVSAHQRDSHGDVVEGGDLTVVIECKGCWNPGVGSDIQEQLVMRYMDNGAGPRKHGLYLVGWYHCEAWRPQPPDKLPLLRRRA